MPPNEICTNSRKRKVTKRKRWHGSVRLNEICTNLSERKVTKRKRWHGSVQTSFQRVILSGVGISLDRRKKSKDVLEK